MNTNIVFLAILIVVYIVIQIVVFEAFIMNSGVGGHHTAADRAFATWVKSEDLVDGALVLGHSLLLHSACVQARECDLVALVHPTLSISSVQRLYQAGWRNISQVTGGLNGVDFLSLWTFVQYTTVAYITPSTLCLRSNCEYVLNLETPSKEWVSVTTDMEILLLHPSTMLYNQCIQRYLSLLNMKEFDEDTSEVEVISRLFEEKMGMIKDHYGSLSLYTHSTNNLYQDITSDVILFSFGSSIWKPWINPALDKQVYGKTHEGMSVCRNWWETYEDLHSKWYSADWGTGVFPDALKAQIPEPHPKTHLWLQRETASTYTRPTASFQQSHTLNVTAADLVLVEADAGTSCNTGCRKYNATYQCQQNALSWTSINNCLLLSEAFKCNQCITHSAHPTWPAWDEHTGQCLVNHEYYSVAYPNCAAVPTIETVQRLCPCFPSSEPETEILPKPKPKAKPPTAPPPKPLSAEIVEDGPCKTTAVNFTQQQDEECIKYLTTFDNIASIKPMPSILAFARTIKWKIRYKLRHIKAIVKVSQEKFEFEPFSEVLAYEVDRILQLKRVPPTAVIKLPIDFLRDSLNEVDEGFRNWVIHDVFGSERVKKQIKLKNNVQIIPGSVQLWIYGLHPIQDTTWHIHDTHHWHNWFKPGAPLPNGPNFETLLPELSDMTVFDYVICNPDRRPDKNTYVVGGCVKDCDAGNNPKYTGAQQLINIDQGSSFYHHEAPESNPLSGHSSQFCRFRKSTVQRIQQIHGSFHQELDKHVDPVVWSVVFKELGRAIDTRLQSIVSHMNGCLKKLGEDKVLLW